MSKPRIICVVGTRPDTIKTAPVVLELRKHIGVETILVATGQHREMLAQALDAFGLKADHDLEIMQHGQTLAQVTTRAMNGLDPLFEELQPSYVMAQGDTTTTFVASLVAFYRQIPFGHIEAGLRTDTIWNPFPEEFNRRAASLITEHHFPPTEWAKENLLREHHPEGKIFVTGNTGVDAVLKISETEEDEWKTQVQGRVILLTTHRRENWGEPQKSIARAALRLVNEHPDTVLFCPMHRNPQVRETLMSILGGHERIRLIEPPEYASFVKLMQHSTLILSDSGGVQEEAPAFGLPVLVLRETTERPEGVEAGVAKLVGTDEQKIYEEGNRLLSDPEAHRSMSHAVSPYGDGKAAARIRYVVLKHLGIQSEEVPMWA